MADPKDTAPAVDVIADPPRGRGRLSGVSQARRAPMRVRTPEEVAALKTKQDAAAKDALARAAAGEPLAPADIMAIWRMSHTQYWRLSKQHAFDHLKCRMPVGLKIYSGVLVTRDLAGEPLYEPSFGLGSRRKRQG